MAGEAETGYRVTITQAEREALATVHGLLLRLRTVAYRVDKQRIDDGMATIESILDRAVPVGSAEAARPHQAYRGHDEDRRVTG